MTTARYALARWTGPSVVGPVADLIVQWRDLVAGSGWYAVWDLSPVGTTSYYSLYKTTPINHSLYYWRIALLVPL